MDAAAIAGRAPGGQFVDGPRLKPSVTPVTLIAAPRLSTRPARYVTIRPDLLLMSQIVGIGTDIIECLRIAQMIERHGDLFINRVYTDHEIKYCQSRKMSTQHFAGRWAAKEAILKALGTGLRHGIGWRDVEVRSEASGRPVVAMRGAARDIIETRGITQLLVSISHCRSHATAYALALGSPLPERKNAE
jgi:holo-[acyl-carrier protein] synthase